MRSCLLFLLCAACGGASAVDAGSDAGRGADAGKDDAGRGADAGRELDAGASDAGPIGCGELAPCPEGMYCDACDVGTCHASPAACTGGDPVCGCDGTTYPSGCEAARAGVGVEASGACGAVCDVGVACEGGSFCEGAGCDDLDWRCAGAGACTDDEVTFCGCDGVEFVGSSTCPLRPWSHMGPCPTTPVSCDVREVFCFETAAPCREGMYREVRDGCWGDCVRVERCACAEDDACPFAGEHTACDLDRGVCTPRG